MSTLSDAQRLLECMQKLSETVISKRVVSSTKGEMFVLNYLYEKKRVVPPGEISAAMNVSSARIAALLNSLESRGLIVRKADTEDRRRIDVELTDSGKKELEAFREKVFNALLKLSGELGEEDVSEYIRISNRIISISEKSLHT